jgi:uncharacterized protein
MIVYLAKKHEFLDDVDSNRIEERIQAEFRRTHHRSVGASEVASWRNSLGFMERILDDPDIPTDAGVAIEFGIPLSAKRIDFMLTGRNDAQQQTAVIIELKQWADVKLTDKDAIVRTRIGTAEIDTLHPSYQAWSYAALIEDYNETVRDNRISLKPCAYLHNCADGSVIKNDFYRTHFENAPAFLQPDAAKLRAFIKQHVRHGDGGQVIYQIRDGKISPSKNLADSLVSLLRGNRDFLMIDDQKIVYETALELATKATPQKKQVLIVEGGPGTGKSVVAVNLLVELTRRKRLVQYVTKNAAPRAVYEAKLTGAFKKSHISNLFVGSGAFTNTSSNEFDSLIVDEAHRLNEKSGLYKNLGENQIKELIQAAKCSVFFLDENQRVTLSDIGSVAEIERWADHAGADVTKLQLASQFRCNGSDGYLAWIDQLLEIRPTANSTLEGIDYDIVVCDSPAELRTNILKTNQSRNKSRMVAGYCWDWTSKKNRQSPDIELAGFSARWNLRTDGNLWIVKPETVNEVGCVHTCQGLELEYVGVIIGPDLVVRDGRVQTDATKRSRHDASIRGLKKLAKRDPKRANQLAAEIIKNTYRTLMTRGQRGCFVYSVDPETNAFLKQAAHRGVPALVHTTDRYPGLDLRVLEISEVVPYVNAIPIFDLQAAAGGFSSEQRVEDAAWVALPDSFVPRKGLFVVRVVGNSMNRRIPNGAWCLFKQTSAGSRNGKVVLAELLDRQDPESGGRYTVKAYLSEKRPTGSDSWEHATITLKPNSSDAGYSDITFTSDSLESLKIVGEFIAVL